MDLKSPSQIPELLRNRFADQKVKVTFTQWETEDADADEEVTIFEGYLIECAISENDFNGMDGAFHFKTDDEEEVIEILMDFPMDGEDIVASSRGQTVQLFGNESELRIESVQ